MKKIIKNILKRFNYQLMPLGTIAMDRRQMDNLIRCKVFTDKIKDVPGAIVECGVGKGRTLMYFTQLCPQRSIYGFDSFEGFPEPSREDDSPRNPKKGEWSGTSVADVERQIKVAGLKSSVTYFEGFFSTTIRLYEGKPIALLHIDADLYQSYKDAFQLVKFVAPGGVILFDEYNTAAFPGATQAVDEFIKEAGLELKQEAGRYYVVKK